MVKNIPNMLTVLRLVLIPFIVIAIDQEQYILAIVLFSFSSLTDILDGVIARKFGFITDFGKLMDPVADKLTQLSIVAVLWVNQVLPLWMFLALFLKEFVVCIGALFLYKRRDVVVSSKWYGKVTTVLMYLAVVSSLLIKLIPSIGKPFLFLRYEMTFDMIIYLLAFLFALFSLLSYTEVFGGFIFKKKKEDKE